MEAIKNEEVEKVYVGKNASGSIKKSLAWQEMQRSLQLQVTMKS